MTDQRLTLHVPDATVETSMNLGAAWNGTPPGAGTAWNGRGMCVNSAGRVWLDANGASSSTFGALSNAVKDDNTAGLLYQSLASWVYAISKEANITTSNGSVFVAGGSGVKIVAGHGAPILPFGIDSGTSTQLANVRPDETSPSSAYAATYADYLEEVAKGWAITDTIVAGALTLLDVGLMIAETCKGSPPKADLGTGLMVMGSAANLAGMGVNIGGMSGGNTPGIQIHASANINFATTGFCSIHSGAGMLLFGALTSGLGFATAGVTGFVNAGLKACLMTGVEGKNVSITAGGGNLDVGAKAGKLNMTGATFQLGANTPADTAFAKTQGLTMKVEGEALRKVTLESLNVSLDSKGSTALEGGVVNVAANTEITIRGPGYTVKVGPSGIDFELLDKNKVAVGADSAMFDCVGAQALKVDAKSVQLGGKTTNIKIDASGSIIWQAPTVNFL